MDKIAMWITAAIGSLIGTAIVSLFTGGGASLFIMKFALSTAVCRVILGIAEKRRKDV